MFRIFAPLRFGVWGPEFECISRSVEASMHKGFRIWSFHAWCLEVCDCLESTRLWEGFWCIVAHQMCRRGALKFEKPFST